MQLFPQSVSELSASTTRIQIEAGDFGTVSGELVHTTVQNRDAFTVSARTFHSDGFARTAYAYAVPLDRTTDLDQSVLQLDWTQTTLAGTRGTLTARVFSEDRGNGTPLQRNRTREAFLSAQAAGRRDLLGHPADWTASAYLQTQEFRNRFTSVDAARTSEIAVLDQYAVPSDAAGAAFTATWSAPSATTTGSGETQENYFRSGDDFIRHRRAGGDQTFAGFFVHHDRALTPFLRGTLAARLDAWQLSDGHRL
ncbi:MAG: hypothetical protein J6386_16440 [Candidatus Synoicihabitans palmerolidicus]|nr:hypothetical protein [Candidatus Synoicihabitans palmerolidicus]